MDFEKNNNDFVDNNIGKEQEILLMAKQAFENVLTTMINKYKDQNFSINKPTNQENKNNITNDYETQIENLKMEITELQSQNKSLNDQITTLKSQLNDTLQINSLKDKITEIHKAVNDFHGIFYGNQQPTPLIQDKYHSTLMNKINLSSIKNLSTEIASQKILASTSFFHSLILSDGRFVGTSSDSKAIIICSFNFKNKSWEININQKNAHLAPIRSFVELTQHNHLLSCSSDYSIKVWKINEKELTFIKQITSHKEIINKILLLSYNKIASCSDDKTIKIYDSNNDYQEIQSLDSKGKVNNMLYLRNRDILVTSVWEYRLDFWNMLTYEKEYSMKYIYTLNTINSMIELTKNRIAVSSAVSPYNISIIDSINYTIIKEIKVGKSNINCSSLCSLNDYSFLYVYNGLFVQYSSEDYEVMFITNNYSKLTGVRVINVLQGGDYLILENKSNGFNVMKIDYC